MYCGRDWLWKLGSWKSKKLDRWIQECKPDVIFYASGDYTFSYDVSLYISRKYNIPLVMSIVDDYYFQRPLDRGVLANYNTWRFRKTMDVMMNHAKGVFFVHPAMQQLYHTRFLTNGAVLYKNALPLKYSTGKSIIQSYLFVPKIDALSERKAFTLSSSRTRKEIL